MGRCNIEGLRKIRGTKLRKKSTKSRRVERGVVGGKRIDDLWCESERDVERSESSVLC